MRTCSVPASAATRRRGTSEIPRLRDILDAAAQRLDQRYAARRRCWRPVCTRRWGGRIAAPANTPRRRHSWTAAAELLRVHLGRDDERSLLAEYELAVMQAHLSQFAAATARLDRADEAAGVLRQSVSEISLRSHIARGDLLYQQMQVQAALDNYQCRADHAADPAPGRRDDGGARPAQHRRLRTAPAACRRGRADQPWRTGQSDVQPAAGGAGDPGPGLLATGRCAARAGPLSGGDRGHPGIPQGLRTGRGQ